MTNVQEILDAAQALPASERAQLIYALWDSIAPDDWPAPSTEWIAEARCRSRAHDAGEMQSSPWAEVRERIRREAGLND